MIAPTAVYLATSMLAAELANVQAEPLAHDSVAEVLDSALAYGRQQGGNDREAYTQDATMAMLAGGAVVRLCASDRRSLDDFFNYYEGLVGAIPEDCPDPGLVLQLDY